MEGYLLMKKSAEKADEYIKKYNVERKRPRSGRFLGEVAVFEGRYDEAVRQFEKSVRLFEKMENWTDRVNALELRGFLAEAMILSGEPERGVAIARKAFLDYDKGDGALLRENDYYTWAVWKSGCVTKTWHALLAKDIPLNKDLVVGMKDMLIDAENLLVIPAGQQTWGDRNFSFRKQEIASIKEGMKRHGYQVE